MNLMKGNINLANEMIDGIKSKTQLDREGDIVRDMVSTLQMNEPKLQKQIPMIEDDSVISVCLLVLEDLQTTMKRFENLKAGKQPEVFIPGENRENNNLLNPTYIYGQSQSSPSPAKKDGIEGFSPLTGPSDFTKAGGVYNSNMGIKHDYEFHLEQILK